MNWIQKLFKRRKLNEPANSALAISAAIDGQEYNIVSDLKYKSDKLTFYKHLSYGYR